MKESHIMLLKTNGENMSEIGLSIMLLKIKNIEAAFHYIYENRGETCQTRANEISAHRSTGGPGGWRLMTRSQREPRVACVRRNESGKVERGKNGQRRQPNPPRDTSPHLLSVDYGKRMNESRISRISNLKSQISNLTPPDAPITRWRDQ